MWGEEGIKHEKNEETLGRQVENEEEEEALKAAARCSRREQGEQTVVWKEFLVSRYICLRIIFFFALPPHRLQL